MIEGRESCSMVDCYDITFDKNWVYASEIYDHDYQVKGTARISRHTDEFYTDCSSPNQFKKALVAVKLDIARGNLKQHANRTVAWY